MPPISPAAYLMKQLNDKGDFTSSYTKLSEKDKNDLKKWAQEEMDALKIEHT